MDIGSILTAKPVLIGLHLGFAIIGIDAFLWLLGEVNARSGTIRKRVSVAVMGLGSYILTWIIGGYYYVQFYGPIVKPIIKAGSAPWAHAIAMEVKEHIFLFAIPLAITILVLSMLNAEELDASGLRKPMMALLVVAAGLGLFIGALGFIISSAVRWGVL